MFIPSWGGGTYAGFPVTVEKHKRRHWTRTPGGRLIHYDETVSFVKVTSNHTRPPHYERSRTGLRCSTCGSRERFIRRVDGQAEMRCGQCLHTFYMEADDALPHEPARQ